MQQPILAAHAGHIAAYCASNPPMQQHPAAGACMHAAAPLAAATVLLPSSCWRAHLPPSPTQKAGRQAGYSPISATHLAAWLGSGGSGRCRGGHCTGSRRRQGRQAAPLSAVHSQHPARLLQAGAAPHTPPACVCAPWCRSCLPLLTATTCCTLNAGGGGGLAAAVLTVSRTPMEPAGGLGRSGASPRGNARDGGCRRWQCVLRSRALFLNLAPTPLAHW